MVVGRYLFDQIPFFEILAVLVSFIVKDSVFPRTFLDIRLVSVVTSAFVTWVIWRYLKNKVGEREAFFGAFLFILTPLSLFYSRYGGREMLLILFSFLFYVSWESMRKSPTKLFPILKTGLLLGLSIYAKLTAFIFLAIPLFYFVISFLNEAKFIKTGFNSFKLSLGVNQKWFKEAKANFLTVSVASLMVFLAFLPFALINKQFFKDRLYLVLFSHSTGSIFDKIQVLNTYITKPVYWLTLTVVLLIILGVIWIWKDGLKKWQDLTFFTLLTLAFLAANEARARYFAISLPFLTIFAALGLGFLVDLVKARVKLRKLGIFVPLIVFLTILPSSYVALESTNHSGFEQAVKILKEKQDGRLVFSSYWPPIIQYISGLPVVRLTDRIEDASRDSGEYPKFSPNVALPPTQILETVEGGWVLVHEPIDRDEFTERKRAISYVVGNYDYFAKITDGKPNFPETNTPYTIYLFDTKVKRTQNANQIDVVTKFD